MSNFEDEIAKKIKEQLDSGELDELKEVDYNIEEVSETNEVIDENITEVGDEKPLDAVVGEDTIIENTKTTNVFKRALGIEEADNKHYNRKEKLRPLALIAGILSLIMSLGVVALSIFAVWKMAIPLIGAIQNIVEMFFNGPMIIFTAIIGWIFCLVLIILAAFPIIAIGGVLLALCISLVQLSINSFKTMYQPKQVFAFDRRALGNIILSYIYGAIASFIGIMMFMDKDQSRLIAILFLVTGVAFVLIATLILIDRIQGKKAYKNLTNEQEKQEIKQEHEMRCEVEKRNKKTKKKIRRFFEWFIRKK